ncbi:MAG: glucose-6-phosphate dehydrogenase [Zavarzinella sp.]
MQTPTIVIFGASGDLTSRKLIPALFRLDSMGLLPDDTQIVGISRTGYSSEQFRDHVLPKVKEAVVSHGESWYPGNWNRFAKRLQYISTDASAPGGLIPLQEWFAKRETNGRGDRLYYLSVAPDLYIPIAHQLADTGLNLEESGFRRLVIEKPFGTDLKSAREVNHQLHQYFREDQLYRIDPYLGKDTVQNILVFRLANSMFEPLWNRRYIDHIQITVAEKVTVGRRGGYYDGSGVLRDMFQSHLLQVMTMVAMEPPSRITADRLRNEKMKVLDSILVPSQADAHSMMKLGQYQGYHQEDGVPKESKTPTYAAVKLMVENWRWKGVPFYLRSGKGLKSRYSEVVIQFREPPFRLFPHPDEGDPSANRITLMLQPNEGIRLNFLTKIPEVEGTHLHARDLEFNYTQAYGKMPEAYERLLLDALLGDASLFMRGDEIERSWEIMDPFIAASEAAESPIPPEYPLGCAGPECAERMIADDGRTWQMMSDRAA